MTTATQLNALDLQLNGFLTNNKANRTKLIKLCKIVPPIVYEVSAKHDCEDLPAAYFRLLEIQSRQFTAFTDSIPQLTVFRQKLSYMSSTKMCTIGTLSIK